LTTSIESTMESIIDAFLRFADLLPEAMLLVTVEGMILAANRGFGRRLDLSVEEMSGRSLFQLSTDSAKQLSAYLQSCARSEELLPGSLVLVDRRGSRTVCQVEGALFRPASGTVSQLLMLRLSPRESASGRVQVLNQRIDELSREVAHRRRIEQVLAEQKEWLRTTLESIGDAVIATDTGSQITFLNSVAQALTGWTQDEAVGQPLMRVFRIVNEKTRLPAEDPVDRALRDGIVVGLANHTILLSRHGNEIPIEDSASPIRDGEGNIRGAVLVFHDVAERRRAEQETDRLNRELYRRVSDFETLLRVVPVCIAVADDPECRRIWSNPYFARLLDVEPSANISMSAPAEELPTSFSVMLNGREVPPEELPLQLATRTGQEVRNVELNMRLHEGPIVDLQCSAAPLFDEADRVRGGVFAGVDITERKNHEALLEGQKRALERMVQGAPLPEILESLCEILEGQFEDGRIATILLLSDDGTYLIPVAGRSAPAGWTRVIQQVPVSPSVGSCGTAAFRRSPVIASDIASDPLWASYREAALGHGFRACWSTPILCSRGEVLGTFAVYYRTPNAPGPGDTGLVEILTRTASIAIERRKAEISQRESEEQFRTLADSIPQLCWMTRPDGHILWYNRRWYEYTGTTADQMEGWGWQSVHDPAELPRVLETWKAALASGEAWEDTFPLRRRDGQMRWHLSRAIPVRDESGRIVRWFGTNTDIEDRREAESRLARYAERQPLLWEAAAVLLTTNEPEAMLRGLFDKIAPHFGLDCYFNFLVAESGDSLRLASCAGIPDEERRRIARLEFGQAICGKVAVERCPIAATFIQQSTEPRVQLVKSYGIRSYACSPLLVGDRLLGTLSFASKTRDQFGEDELEFMRTICHYVTVAYERLRLVNELRLADHRKDEFLATLAHELRNPLAPIRNALQILNLKPNVDPDTNRLRSMVERQIVQLVRLVDELLDLSRISRGKIDLQKAPISITDVIQNAAETSGPLIEAGNHDLDIRWPRVPLLVDGDMVRLTQVFANLLNNAAKYTPQGGRISVVVERRDARAVVAVRDNGLGIPPEMLGKVFEMFTQINRHLGRAQGGLGIGLTLVKRLVEMHGGTITVRSEGEGKGTEFTVELPLAKRTKIPGEEKSMEHTNQTGRRILIADDNGDAADSLALMLELLGHATATTHDGQEALQVAESFHPDIVVLDIGMPRLNGYEAARKIREHPWGEKAVLIALTGWGQEEDRRRSREAGFDHHLVKPVDPPELIKLLEAHGTSGHSGPPAR
jgi:PAS domain S-box-containing protein